MITSIEDMTTEQIEQYVRNNATRYGKAIWNAAIEKAASIVDQANRDGPYQAIGSVKEIKKLKVE